MNTARSRLALVTLAGCWLLMAWGFFGSTEDEVLWPTVWGPAFVLAAGSTLWLAVSLSRPPLFTSAAVILLAFGWRVVASWYRVEANRVEPSRIFITIGVYSAIAVLVAIGWVRVFGPVVSWHQQQKG